jgi:hypothetical protein
MLEWEGDQIDWSDWAEPEDEFNGRLCPYYARYWCHEGHDPEAICTFGCRDEPECVTCEPTGGWPELADDD